MNEQINNTLLFPMLVSNLGTADFMTKEENAAIWTTYMTLPQIERDRITAFEVPRKMRELQDKFGLKDETIGKISLCTRKIFFGELSLQECEAKIGSMLAGIGGGDPNQAKAIVEFIQKEIIELKPKPRAEEAVETEEKTKGMTVSMPLLQALSKYENLGNQLITQERIRVKSQAEPVRPSLLYWLKYYRDDIGIGHHDSVQRGQFLFRSENGRRLSAEERERLGLILKSVEEDFPLAIDTEHQEIVFPVFQGVMAGGEQPPRALPANARLTRSPAFVDNGAGDERAKKFIPASNPALQYSDAGRLDRAVAAENASGGLRMGRGMHFGNLEQTKMVSSDSGVMSFSATHIFPAEKEITEKQVSVEKKETPPAPRPVSPASKPNPFHIHPVSLGKKVEMRDK